MAVGSAASLRRLRSLTPFGVMFCAVLGAVSLVSAGPAAADLRPDPPKLPQRPPPPPPQSLLTPQRPQVAPPPPAPLPAPPPPAQSSYLPPRSAARPTSTSRKKARPATTSRKKSPRVSLRTARAHRTVGWRPARSIRVPAAVAVPTRPEPASPVSSFSSSRSNPTVIVALTAPMAAMGLLLVVAVMVPARSVPWPEPARVLSERREDLAFAGIAILAATAVCFLLLLMT
jgi:hypothetical protein